ncbi:MAG: tetratricopeptide repeat protein [Desulfobulbus sp.]
MKIGKHVKFLLATCIFLATFCAIAGPAALAAPRQSAEILFQQGNNLYEQGNYQQALQIFTSIVTEDGFSGPLLYNLANCYAQTGQTGQAILNYQRALRLSPGDADIQGNLDLLRKNNGLFQEDRPLTQRMASLLTFDQWTLSAGLFFVLFTLAILLDLRFSTAQYLKSWIGGICLLGTVIAIVGAFSQYRQQDEAVVTSPDAHLLLSPFPSAASTGTIQEGRAVYPTTKHGQFTFIEDQSGRTGWVESKAITSIMAFVAPSQKEQNQFDAD